MRSPMRSSSAPGSPAWWPPWSCCAAATACCLLDRCRAEEIGGLAREAFGGMFMVDSPEQRRSRIPDSERLALEDWLRIAEFDPEDVWPKRWAEQYVTRARDDVGAG